MHHIFQSIQYYSNNNAQFYPVNQQFGGSGSLVASGQAGQLKSPEFEF